MVGLTGPEVGCYLIIGEPGQAMFSGNLSLWSQQSLAHRISFQAAMQV